MEARSMQESLLTWNREAYESLITLNGHQRYVIISMQIHLNSNNLVLFRYVKLCRLKWIKARISMYIWSLFASYLFMPSFLFSPRGQLFYYDTALVCVCCAALHSVRWAMYQRCLLIFCLSTNLSLNKWVSLTTAAACPLHIFQCPSLHPTQVKLKCLTDQWTVQARSHSTRSLHSCRPIGFKRFLLAGTVIKAQTSW